MVGLTERCPTCGFDPATVSPSDATAAARSYPRRWRGLLVRPDDDDPAIVKRRPSPAEPSAVELAARAAATFSVVADALRRVQVEDEPDVHIEPSAAPETPSLEVVLDRLAAEAGVFAAALDAVKGEGWQRRARVDGTPLRAVDLARHGVHRGIHNLRQAESTLDRLR